MTQKPTYDETRTDNIEVLFNSLFYLQLLDGCEKEINKLKKQLAAEFNQFPVEFDKQRNAYRHSYPYRYNENGIVTMFGSDYTTTEKVVLDAWTPENRPETKEKKKANRKPNYSPMLYNGHPIWFLQIILHEGRKTTAHRNHLKREFANYSMEQYGNTYKKMRILDTLSADERAPFESRDIDVEYAMACRHTLQTIGAVFRNNPRIKRILNQPESPDYIPFFFLNESEIEKLTEAIQFDNKAKKIRRYYHNNKMVDVMNEIIHAAPADRVYLDIEYVFDMTKTVATIDPNQRYKGVHEFEILDHKNIWEKLHEQFIGLDDNHLHLLREFNLLNDELFQEIKDELEETDHVENGL